MAIFAITNKTKPQQYIEKLNTLLGLWKLSFRHL